MAPVGPGIPHQSVWGQSSVRSLQWAGQGEEGWTLEGHTATQKLSLGFLGASGKMAEARGSVTEAKCTGPDLQ